MALELVDYVSQHRFYNRWKTLNKMFTNPNNKHYEDYGAKGVAFEKEWARNNPEGSRNFVMWMDEQFAKDPSLNPERAAVIRKTLEGNFGPNNCIVVHRRDVSLLAAEKHK